MQHLICLKFDNPRCFERCVLAHKIFGCKITSEVLETESTLSRANEIQHINQTDWKKFQVAAKLSIYSQLSSCRIWQV